MTKYDQVNTHPASECQGAVPPSAAWGARLLPLGEIRVSPESALAISENVLPESGRSQTTNPRCALEVMKFARGMILFDSVWLLGEKPDSS